ncbi:hypothetical protein D3C73_1390100 [compost metagenome]
MNLSLNLFDDTIGLSCIAPIFGIDSPVPHFKFGSRNVVPEFLSDFRLASVRRPDQPRCGPGDLFDESLFLLELLDKFRRVTALI